MALQLGMDLAKIVTLCYVYTYHNFDSLTYILHT